MSKQTIKILLILAISVLVAFGVGVSIRNSSPEYRGAQYETVSCDLVDLTGDSTYDIMMCDGGLTVPLAELPREQAEVVE